MRREQTTRRTMARDLNKPLRTRGGNGGKKMTMTDSEDIAEGIAQGERVNGNLETATVARGVVLQSIHSIIIY